MKKTLAATLLATFVCVFTISPASAILEKKNKEEIKLQSTLEKVNFDWWQKQDDKYLEDYILRALKNNNDVKTAQLNLEQAEINVMAARVAQLPTLAIGAAPALAKMPQKTNTMGSIALPIIAQYELDYSLKNWDKTKSAKKLLKGAQFQTAAIDIAIVSYVATTYYNIVKLDKTIALQEEIVKDKAKIYELMKYSNAQGVASTSDLILAEKSYILAQNSLIEYKKTRQNALNALAVLTGDSAENTKEYKRISYDELKSNFDIPNEISSDIIVNRPDYKAMEYQLQAAGLDVRIAKKEFLPTINILGLLTFLATSTVSQMNWNNSLALLAGSVDLPLFTGFAKTANLKLNKNKYEQMVTQYQKTNLVAIQEVNDSLYNFKSDKERFDNNIKALNIQTKDFGYIQDKYNQGVISKLDMLQQREALLFTQQLTASSKLDCYIDKIGLYKTTGAQI